MKKVIAVLAGILTLIFFAIPVCAAESLETFDYKAYADTYPDVKAVYGYDAAALYNHYMVCGKAEGRVGTFAQGENAEAATAAVMTSEALDPLPPLVPSKLPAWFDARTLPTDMTNARLVAEYYRITDYIEEHDLKYEPTMMRDDELELEIYDRANAYLAYERCKASFGEDEAAFLKEEAAYKRAVASDITPLARYLK